MKKYWYLVFSFTVLFSSCNREPIKPHQVHYVYPDSSTAAYLLADKQGDTLIYQIDGDNNYDTTVVTGSGYAYFNSIKKNEEQDLADNNVQTLYSVGGEQYNCQKTWDFSTAYTLFWSKDSGQLQCWYSTGPVSVAYRYQNTWHPDYPPDTSEKAEIIPTVILNQKEYHDVLWFRIGPHFDGYTQLYFVKGLGIIKKIDISRHIFVLVKKITH